MGSGGARGAPITASWLLSFAALSCSLPPDAPDDAGRTADAAASRDAGTDASEPTCTAATVTRRFDPADCTDRRGLGALPEEANMWGAARLTLPAGAHTLSCVGYELAPFREGEMLECGDGVAHRVQVFTAPAGEPPATDPVILVEIDVPSTTPTNARRDFVHVLPTAVEVPEGHDVFVSLEMVRTPEGALCGVSCGQDEYGGDTFWSNATSPPYAWAPLRDFGLTMELGAWVGHD